jgi:hypothetical protein
MSLRPRQLAVTFVALFGLIPLEAATVSPQTAEEFAQKVALIQRQGDSSPQQAGMRRTRLTQDELNSWFMYRAQPLLPNGVGQPQVTIVGDGRVAGQAIVDLEVPVGVTGILHTRDGMARFEVQSAEMSGIPVPVTVLQELLTYYSRTPERPQGVRLDDAFALPANIRQIEVGQGQAVVVQ